MTKNLIAFGCSLTYGHGLPDCHIPPSLPGPVPSSLAWPSRLALLAGKNCINQAKCGAGNFEIALSVISYQFDPQDICFILWSYPDRDIILHDDLTTEQLGPWLDHKKFKAWNWLNPGQTKSTKFWYHVVAINHWLKVQDVTCYNLSVGLEYYSGSKPSWADSIKFLSADIQYHRFNYPRALDNRHPGTEGHEAMARTIAQEVGWI